MIEVEEPVQVQIEPVEEIKPEPIVIEEGLIEEKLKKLLPGLVAKVKTEIEEEVSERSRIYDQNQPLIIEDEVIENKSKEGKMETEQKRNIYQHKGVTCDGCGKNDIQGIRYKCAVCVDFDYCEQCEASVEHVHPFLKIRNVDQTPVKIIAVIRD